MLGRVFKAYDIRGTYPDLLNEQMAWQIGYGTSKFLRDEAESVGDTTPMMRNIIVGRDMRKSSPSLTSMGGPNRTDTAGLPRIGHDLPLGIAAYVPRRAMGTAGIPKSMHSRDAPWRKRPIHPSGDLVQRGFAPNPNNQSGQNKHKGSNNRGGQKPRWQRMNVVKPDDEQREN